MTSIVLGLWGDGTWQKEKVKRQRIPAWMRNIKSCETLISIPLLKL